MGKRNSAVEHWLKAVKECLGKWNAEKKFFDENWWPYFDLPFEERNNLQFRWTDAAARSQLRRFAQAGQPLDAVAGSFIKDANSVLDRWEEFVTSARAELLPLLQAPAANGVDRQTFERLVTAVAEVQVRPDIPTATEAAKDVGYYRRATRAAK